MPAEVDFEESGFLSGSVVIFFFFKVIYWMVLVIISGTL